MSKRKLQDTEHTNGETILSTPSSKRVRRVSEHQTSTKSTPTKPRSKVVAQAIEEDATPKLVEQQETPKSRRTALNHALVTPRKDPDGKNVHIVQNANRSARRRSARNLIEQTVLGEVSDDDDLGGQSLAREIIQEEESEAGSESEADQNVEIQEPETPSKSAQKQKTSRRKRSPTPPDDLAPHERYFYDNRSTAAKTSMNALNSSDLISHSAYHEAISQEEDPHTSSIENLHDHHTASFSLWMFELSQQFSLYLYGYGSKRNILRSFAAYLHQQDPERSPTTIMINGAHPDISIKSILMILATTVMPGSNTKLPAQPQHLASMVLSHLTSEPPSAPIYLLVSALHTKSLTSQQSLSILGQLSEHESIHLVVTVDNPVVPILFPVQLRAKFNFLFHDTTTFLPYDSGTADSELSTVVDSVLELIGRKTSAAAGREGVRWVLKSLPENARGLYRILVSEILAAAAEGLAPAFDTQPDQPLGEDMTIDTTPAKARSKRQQQANHGLPGIDAKVLYQKAVEEFLCSSEMMFWSLLKEFMDHRMVLVRKERGLAGGGEMLGVEMGKEELEGVLEDLLD